MITIKALPPSSRPSLLPRASNQGFAQSIMQKYRHGEGRDPGYLALIHRDFSPSIGGQENHFYQTVIHVRMHVQMGSYLGLNREMLPNGQAGLPGSKERVVMTEASGSGRKIRSATLIHELFRKWEPSKSIEKVYLPRIMVVSNGTDRYHWSKYVQSSVPRASSLEKWLPLWRSEEQIHPADFAPPEFLVHTSLKGDAGERRSMQNERERIRLELATRVNANWISRLRATRSEEVRFEQSGVRYFLQFRRGMEPRFGIWSSPVLLKKAEGRAANSFLERSVRTEREEIGGRDITNLIVHESERTRWSVASQQTELWGSLSWQQGRATWLPKTVTAHARLRVLLPIVFQRNSQHPKAKSEWMLKTLSEASFIPLEREILQSNELSKIFTSLLPRMLHRADAGRTNQQAVRERFKQLFRLAQQFPKAVSERGLAVLGSRQRLKQIQSRREDQSSTLLHWLRQLVLSQEQLATVLGPQIEQKQPNRITLHPLQLLSFETMATRNQRNQRTYELLQQMVLQVARLNESVREQSVRFRSSHEQTHFGKTSVIPAVSRASYQQLDLLQQEWWTGVSLRVLHPMHGLPFSLPITRVTDSSQTVPPPPLSQSVVRKSITTHWIQSLPSANASVFFEKRGWLNQPWPKEYLETINEIEREPVGITSTTRFEWKRFVPILHMNRQRWQKLQNRYVSSTHQETNGKSVMSWAHVQQMVAEQLRERKLLATSTHAPRNLLYEPENQSLHPAASMPSRWLMHPLNVRTKESTSEGISHPFFRLAIHFLQNKHLIQMSYEMIRQQLSSQGGKYKQTDVAFSLAKNQAMFSAPERKATVMMVHEHEHSPIWHTVFLKNEQSTSRAFVHTRRHDREIAIDWIGLGGTDHQRLYNTSAKPFSIKEDVFDRNALRRIAAAELGLTILLQKSSKLAAMSEYAKVGSTFTSGKAPPPSSDKQPNDHSRSRKGESNLLRESHQARESSHTRFLQKTASLLTSSLALRARPYLQVMEQIRKAIQTDFRTEAYVQNQHSLSTVLNRPDAQMVVQNQWGALHSLVNGQSVLVPESFMHESGGSIDFVLERLHSRQLSRRSRFQQSNHEHILTVNQKAQTVKRLTSDEAQEVEVRDARLTPLQRLGLFNLGSTSIAAGTVEQAEKNTSLTLVSKPMVAITIQPSLLHALQQGQRVPREFEQRSLSENATHIHRRGLRTADSHASPAAIVQSPSMEYLRKSIPPQEPAVQQATTLPLQRQVDLHVQERAGNQTSLSPQEVERLMDKMMKELDKRLTQERQRRGL
ncbi:hypothetical protein ABER61_09730 [Brevibacillus formosus]|uniref:Uncharacterized protein n=1 Tax=Brevibacillus formosus TaxID=54913 RepID=A0A837KKE1_9BACL|nr:hypothetical protein [Brevibacillus formosus]KLH97928.1 hypothetical protein AA984_18875 [Brevibacillus formosus]MED1957258.1 hypothetical protein [Brevibacillus formosus]PSJ91355.1 hypothetical protein C7R91_24850 [Brevibacillus formosus]